MMRTDHSDLSIDHVITRAMRGIEAEMSTEETTVHSEISYTRFFGWVLGNENRGILTRIAQEPDNERRHRLMKTYEVSSVNPDALITAIQHDINLRDIMTGFREGMDETESIENNPQYFVFAHRLASRTQATVQE